MIDKYIEESTNWIAKHSVNCYFCGTLVDERDCLSADDYNGNDGGDICPNCQDTRKCQKMLSDRYF